MEVAIQLVSVLQSGNSNIENLLRSIKDQGYDGVEVARRFGGLFGHSPVEFRKMLDDNGLKCTGCTTALDDLNVENIHQLAEDYNILGGNNLYCADLIVKQDEIMNESAWLGAAERFNEYALILKNYHLKIGVHNHNTEFSMLSSGRTGWDIFFDNTCDLVLQELDTYHCIEGGGNPAYYINKYQNRTPIVHIKEFPRNQDIDTGGLLPDPIAAGKYMIPFGEGTSDWMSIFEACKNAKVEWYVAECYMGIGDNNDIIVSRQMIDFIRHNLNKMA